MIEEYIKNWIEGLLKVSRKIDTEQADEATNLLIGYCESGEAFLERDLLPSPTPEVEVKK